MFPKLLLLQLMVICILNAQWWNNEVFELTNENVMDVVGKSKVVVIDFFTPWCFYCQKLNKDYLKVHEYFKNSNEVLIAKVNCEENEQICDFYKIPVFPTIIIVSGNSINKFKKFNGNQDFLTIKSWIQNYVSSQKGYSKLDKKQQHLGSSEQKVISKYEQKDGHQHFDYGGNSKQIFEFIFSIFEQMEKQNRVFDKKVKQLDKQIGMMKYSDEQIFKRIKFDSHCNFNGLLAMIILMVGVSVSLISYYSFSRLLGSKVRRQVVKQDCDLKELQCLKENND